MSHDIQIFPINETFIRIACERNIAEELNNTFKFRPPNYQFTPSFKNKMWDGYIKLFNIMNYSLYKGLLPSLVDFANENEYNIGIDESVFSQPHTEYSDEYLHEFISKLDLSARNKAITPKSYQFDAFKKCVNDSRLVILSPTSSGKSLVIYMTMMFHLKHNPGKVLIVVPTTSLVEQMYNDFEDYAKNIPVKIESVVHRVYSGKEKTTKLPVTISTWQSIYRLKKQWFDDYSAVLLDEAHMGKAECIKGVLEKSLNATTRIGLTGTLTDSKCHSMVLTGLFGPIEKMITTKELMKRNDVSQLDIDILLLKHDDKNCKSHRRSAYHDEVKFLITSKERNKFISSLCGHASGNTLILTNYVNDHAIPLHDMLTKLYPTRKVHLITKSTPTIVREEVRKSLEHESNAIIVATYGVFSTGISINRLHNIIFGSPSKSLIRVLQSIGRLLRLHESKGTAKLYDLMDDLSGETKHQNYSFKHGIERINIYDSESFTYNIHRIDI